VSSNVEKKIPVTVVSTSIPLTAILVSPEAVTVNINARQQITATPEPSDASDVSFVWASNRQSVATVSSTGLVTGVSAGEAIITVRSGDIETTVPVTVVQPFAITVGSVAYAADTIDYREIAPGVKWLKFNMPEFVNGFGTLGKGLVSNLLEIDLSQEGVRLEVCPASQATIGNVERPTAMYARTNTAYSGTGRRVVAATNGDFYLLPSSNTTGYAYIDNRPQSMEASNGMLVQTSSAWSNNGFIFGDNRTPSYGKVSFSGTVEASGQTFPLAEVNGFAGAGQMTLFNNLSNSYPTDSAFAWSPYVSTMVSLSYPENGWRVNDRMQFTVSKIEHDVETAIPARYPESGGKNFNGEGAILVGNSAGNPNQTLGIGNNPESPHEVTVSDHSAYFELQTTGGDPFVYTTTLTSSVSGAATASFSFEYQSVSGISDFQIFYGKPGAAGGVSTDANLQLSATGIDAADNSKWRTFTLDLKPAIDNHNWGQNGHALRLDFGGTSGNHLLIRNMNIAGTSSGNDSHLFLSSLNVGDEIGVTMNVLLNGTTLTDKHLNVIGHGGEILRQGNIIPNWNEAHPRTALGYSQDGKTVYLLVVDGRQTGYSVGATTDHIAEILKFFGAYMAVNLDGGGSSCMVVEGEIKNKSSDGVERAVANGIIVTVEN
jgi:hypothetical protein